MFSLKQRIFNRKVLNGNSKTLSLIKMKTKQKKNIYIIKTSNEGSSSGIMEHFILSQFESPKEVK